MSFTDDNCAETGTADDNGGGVLCLTDDNGGEVLGTADDNGGGVLCLTDDNGGEVLGTADDVGGTSIECVQRCGQRVHKLWCSQRQGLHGLDIVGLDRKLS